MLRGRASAFILWPLITVAAAEQERHWARPYSSAPLEQAEDVPGQQCLLQLDAVRRPLPGAPAAAAQPYDEVVPASAFQAAAAMPVAAAAQASEEAAPASVLPPAAVRPNAATPTNAVAMSLLYGIGPVHPAGAAKKPSGSEVDLMQMLGLGGAAAAAEKDGLPKKSKAVLMILEMVPLAGPLGVDRFYLGDTSTGIAKLVVCVCTCFIGGLIWGLLDAIIVIVNCVTRKQTIDTLGMSAQFTHEDVETAHTLALVGVVIQLFCFFGGPRILVWMRQRYLPKFSQPAAAATLDSAGAAKAEGTSR